MLVKDYRLKISIIEKMVIQELSVQTMKHSIRFQFLRTTTTMTTTTTTTMTTIVQNTFST